MLSRGGISMIGRKMIISLIILSILVISACSPPIEEVHVISEEDNNYRYKTFETDDGKVTFKIYNEGQYSKKVVQQIMDETLASYEVIINSIHTGHEFPDNINIYLYAGEGRAYARYNDFRLYSLYHNRYPLVHELTHLLLGVTSESVPIIHEGYAVHMQSKYGKPTDPDYDLPIHEIMKYIYMKKIKISLCINL